MRLDLLTRVAALAFALALFHCGSDQNPGNDDGTGGALTAFMNGQMQQIGP